MILRDDALLATIRSEGKCAWCGRVGAVDAAHILSRGAGRVDIPGNLLPIDRECHSESHHGYPSKSELLLLAAGREGVMQATIQETVWFIRRLPKGTTEFGPHLREVRGAVRQYAKRCLAEWAIRRSA